MNDRTDSLTTRFFADAEDYLSRGKEIAGRLAGLSGDNADNEDVNELFRCAHSIKSEASYLKFEEIGHLAHSLEEKLERLRSGNGANAAAEAPEIAKQLDKILLSVRELKGSSEGSSKAVNSDFNKFEWKLLQEAGRRGENFYRVVFEIESDAPMKQARAYLVLSNLEQISTVVRTEPSLTPGSADPSGNDARFSVITIFLTADVSQPEIYNALDVDQVIRSRVELLDLQLGPQSDFAGETALALVNRQASGGSGHPSSESGSAYRLAGRELDRLTAYADDLRLTVRELELDGGVTGIAGGVERAEPLRKLSRLAGGLYEELCQIRTATVAEEFGRLEEHMNDLASRLSKQVRLSVHGGSLRVDRRILAAVSDPLSHLMRNAVDHGIELPDTRRSIGKDETGTISLSAEEEGDRLKITVSDDGSGIDEDALRRELAAAGQTAGADLMEILSTPGFTTLDEATDLSGRGVGLDLVARRVEEIGGEIKASAVPGKGVTFELSIPKGVSFSRLLFFRFGSVLYALPGLAVAEIKRINKGDLKRNGEGRVFYLGYPAFTGEQPAKVGVHSSYGSYAIQISYLGKRACLLGDDVLFEHEVQDDLLTGGKEERRLAISFGSGKREFIYLSPAALLAE